ncbi:MAG: peptidase prolyl oligopeptidase active site domain protein [Acidimicrobiales bacterium]|nr:peptidase prolyl oligopeptidase active site domain protein [Acidimicrobiales bacterium]
MVPADIGALVAAGDPRVSPDGLTVAFTVTTIDLDANEYRSSIWVAAADGSSEPHAFTSGEHKDATPRWSPDGRSLAFVRHKQDSKETEVCVIPAGGGEAKVLLTWKDEVSDLAWSPDGGRLAFTARQRDEERYGKEKEKDQPPRRITRLFSRLDSVGWISDRPTHLFAVDVEGGEPSAVTGGEFEDGGLAWSPDGSELAFAAGRHDTWDLDYATDLFTVPVDGGEPTRLTETGPQYARPSFKSDGSAIAFHLEDWRSAPRHGQVGVLDRTTGDVRILTAGLDRNCSPYPASRPPVWDGADLLFLLEESGNVHLYRVPADGTGKPELVLGGDRQLGSFDLAGGTLAYTVTTPTGLPEMFVRIDGEDRQLTHLGDTFVEEHSVVAPERFTATSADGTEVEAWILPPVDREEGRRYPTLLNIHGGPFTQYGNRFFDEFQLQAAAGYAVVYANPRGSSGSSEAWGRAIRGRTTTDDPGSGWGGVDYEDLMAVVDQASARFDFVDPERVGAIGGSYGGYMTSWMIGHTDRFKAVVSERACNNLLTMEHTSDVAGSFRTEIGVSHLDDPDEFLRQSPITYVRDMHTPLLIIHSENDLRCAIEQAEELFVALRMLGRTPEFLRFPGESHELSRSGAPRHRVQRVEAILDFFGRKL